MTWVDPQVDPWGDDGEGVELPGIVVHEVDNPTVAVLYGPDGEPLVVFKERGTVPFGYQPPPEE